MSTLRPVAGRFDSLRSPKGYTAIVDYAHTPDALENVLNAIHEVLNGKGHVITVVGAGGNRDKGKRPLMAQEAVKQSDKVIITSDNPRFEEPQEIINDMLAGLTKEDMRKVISIADRKEAIRTACMLAQAKDVILVAGKGHENYQEIKGIKHHFDDKEVLRDILLMNKPTKDVILFISIFRKVRFPGAGMFGYVSFRSLMAIILSLLISAIFGEYFINLLKRKQITETQRDASIDPLM